MKRAVLIVAIALLAVPSFAQLPPSWEAVLAEVQMDATQGPVQVGEDVRLTYRSPRIDVDQRSLKARLAWTADLYFPGASYIAPHFEHFNLPAGAYVIVRSPDDSRSWTYEGTGKADLGLREGFWGIHIAGDRAYVELHSRTPVPEGAVVIDRFARGYDRPSFFKAETEAICGTDDSRWAQCYTGTEMYNKARAVARLLMNGSSACTGWLVGDQGHLMTNNHCIGSSSTANNTNYEFMAEGSCSTECKSWLGCPGTVVATSATLIQTDGPRDYTLVKLPTNPSGTYGFLQMRQSGAVVDERIYIPQHAAAWGKRIAVTSGASQDQSGFCEVYTLNLSACQSGGPPDVGYYCDTQGGSSGSPVLAYGDHCVVALHHCANCPNRGVPIDSVISDLGSNLPANSLCDAGPCVPTEDPEVSCGDGVDNDCDSAIDCADSDCAGLPACTCGQVGDSCTVASDCCGGKCKGKAGAKTCK